MFHISEDLRAQKSAEMIRDGLMSCLADRPFERISVTDICQKSGVSRTTFYRLFDTPTDIISWSTDHDTLLLCQAFMDSGLSQSEWPFRFSMAHILDHPNVMELAIRANRVDIADAAFQRNINKVMEQMRAKSDASDIDMHYSDAIVSAIIVAAFSTWLKKGKKDSPEQVLERVFRILKNISKNLPRPSSGGE